MPKFWSCLLPPFFHRWSISLILLSLFLTFYTWSFFTNQIQLEGISYLDCHDKQWSDYYSTGVIRNNHHFDPLVFVNLACCFAILASWHHHHLSLSLLRCRWCDQFGSAEMVSNALVMLMMFKHYYEEKSLCLPTFLHFAHELGFLSFILCKGLAWFHFTCTILMNVFVELTKIFGFCISGSRRYFWRVSLLPNSTYNLSYHSLLL